MADFGTADIRNVLLAGSRSSGKTTLAETMMFEANLINRRGSVENGNTVAVCFIT